MAYLTGPQIKAFVEALGAAFGFARFDRLLLGRLNKNREDISLAGDYEGIRYDVVKLANNEGWVTDLLTAARASNPANAALLAFEELLGLGAIAASQKPKLEKIVRESSPLKDSAEFRERLGLLETWICAMEIPGGGGSGVLVGPDLVLTHYHVVAPLLKGEASPSDARCRLDYRATDGGDVVNAGVSIGLAADWDVHHSRYSQADTVADGQGWIAEELDFALVRLSSSPGEAPIGNQPEAEAPNRGWLRLPVNPAAMTQGDVLFVLQHPQDLDALPKAKLQRLKLSSGTVLGFVGNGLRMRHDATTLPGSSGSPCFNAALEPVALHHAGEKNSRLDYKGAYNQAIPLGEIAKYLKKHGLESLLDAKR